MQAMQPTINQTSHLLWHVDQMLNKAALLSGIPSCEASNTYYCMSESSLCKGPKVFKILRFMAFQGMDYCKPVSNDCPFIKSQE